MPTYKPNIPLPTDTLATSQGDLLGNFQQLNTAFNIDHLTYNDVNQGKHNTVHLLNAGVSAVPSVSFINLYNDASELYIKKFSGVIEKLSGWDKTEASPGRVVFPNGIIIMWGSNTATSTMADKNFPLSGFPNNCWTIVTSTTDNQAGTSPTIYRLNALVISKTVYRAGIITSPSDPGGTANFNFIAIGN